MEIYQHFMHALTAYYGLDWLTLATGIAGSWMLTNRNRWGFFTTGIACLAAFATSLMADQFGFVAYNLILLVMMVRGFYLWGRSYRGGLEAAE